MQAPVRHIIHRQHFWISHERVIFWEDEGILIVSDLHFGKSGHFRKSGIGVPQTVFKEDLQRLVALLQFFSPKQLLVVGDMFHSAMNKELELFRRWREDLPDLSILLVKGNHDILKEEWYQDAGIALANDGVVINGICFTHDKSCSETATGLLQKEIQYTISGHIHPGIRLRGLGKQSLCLPCFYFGKEYAVLPAFSRFTGTALIEPKAGDDVFAIANNKLVLIHR
jgi:DNA ligase-associated metallophosphoesterase